VLDKTAVAGTGWLSRSDKGDMPSVSFKYFYILKGKDDEKQAVFGHGIIMLTMWANFCT